MKKHTLYSMAGLGAITILTAGFLYSRTSAAGSRPAAVQVSEGRVAAPGRIEPVSEELKISAELNGKLREVRVEEGDTVERGQIIAVLENADFEARVSLAEAQLKLKEAELRRVVNGARTQERREAWAAVKEADAVMLNAETELRRRETGFQQGVFAKEEADRAAREFGVAKARYEAAKERHDLIQDNAREEDRTRAEAEVSWAHANLDEARAMLNKTFVKSPLSGVILRKHLRPGESVNISDKSSSPVFTLGDSGVLRVRMDVDEADVSRVRVGQKAYVTAATYGDHKFWGHVVRVGQLLGKKNVRTDEPSERVDQKILETLIELDPGQRLPAGLRVDAFVLVKE
ncbi:MAG: efflux RND transporter periplasmic adaptor subunit [Acidobacteria bacterium]|nr:efflux RND transporter periplasmic adaptor subunit [Acidobacteriota bacterium]